MNQEYALQREDTFDFVHDSQRVFKMLMMSLAKPGDTYQLEPLSLAHSNNELNYILQPFLTLLDLEATFSVACNDQEEKRGIESYLSLNTKSPVADYSAADFILCLQSTLNGVYSELKRGTLLSPDDSATIFYQVDKVSSRPFTGSSMLTLDGPGIERQKKIFFTGIAEEEIETWMKNRFDYPMGIDIYLVDREGVVVGLPRSINIHWLAGG